MTDPTNVRSKQVIRQEPRDNDALLHGQHSGSFSSELHACTERIQIAFEQRHHGNVLREPTEVGGNYSESDTSAIDSTRLDDKSASLPIPAAELQAAATRLRSDPASTKAVKRLLEGGWTARNDDDIGELVITFDPRSKAKGKKRPSAYTTKQDSCTCPGAIIRGGCYHPVAWQIVNEALSPTTAIQCTLPSALFLPLCLLAIAGGAEDVTLSAESARGTLTLAAPGLATGTVSVELATSVLLTIEQRLRTTDLKRMIDALASALPPEGDQIMLDLSPESLLIIGGTEDVPVFVDGLDILPNTQHHASPV